MFGRETVVRRKRLGCWFYVAVIALLANPMLWHLVLSGLIWLLQVFAVHVALWSFR